MEFKIVLRERWTWLNPQRNPVEGYRITFQLADGTVDYVLLPEGQYDPDAVAAAIGEKLARHEAVMQLGAH